MIIAMTLALSLLFSTGAAPSAAKVQSDEEAIRKLTDEFCRAMLAKDLDAIDRVFDPAGATHYDINESVPSYERLKSIWRAATGNYTLTRFAFKPDMKIAVSGDLALQTGSWEQSHVNREGASRDFSGRATIVWKRTAGGWRVQHYHASVTPPRQAQQ